MESIACMPRFAFSSDATAAASIVIGSIGVVNQKRYEYDHGHLQSEERTTQGLTRQVLYLFFFFCFFPKKNRILFTSITITRQRQGARSGCALGWHIYICRQCMMSSAICWIQAWLWSSKETQLKARYVRSCNWSSWPCGRICTTLRESSIYWCILKWTIKRSIYYEMTSVGFVT